MPDSLDGYSHEKQTAASGQAPAPATGEGDASFYTPPALPKGGGTVSVGGGMLSAGGPDGSAGWQMPLPSPAGRALSAELALHYSSGGGNSAFGAGWDCDLPAIFCMTRFGFPKYDGNDRMVGPSGEEVLKAGAPHDRTGLPFAETSDGERYSVTPWCLRSGAPSQRLEHWVVKGAAADPGFWLHWQPDGSLSLFGWSASARLHDPAAPERVAGWYLEERVSARGEHLVYRYRAEDDKGCSDQELKAHPHVVNLYADAVYAMNATPSQALLIPQDGFDETDFLTFTQFDYGERGADPERVPGLAPEQDWPVRDDCHSFWRYGFNVRIRRLCRDVLLWHRTARMNGEADDTPELVARLHLQYDSSPVSSILVSAQQLSSVSDCRLPPMEFELTRPGRAKPGWEAMPALDGFWAPAWQMADLLGEGVPGLLYRDQDAWHYRPPMRQGTTLGAEQDAITWGAPWPLPKRPADSTGSLTDLDGDGRPEWLITEEGMRGSFTLAPDGIWGAWKPLLSLPSEYGHEAAQMTDLTGDGRSDVVMLHALGPRSVRLYPSAGADGWLAAVTAQYAGREALPLLDRADRQLVAFADPAGSGQSHLLRITGDGVTLWPSLGYGRFDEAISIPGFKVDNFNASRVYLADIDGTGTTDILYLEPARIRVFISQCGNRFVEGPAIEMPPGVTLDSETQLQVADIRGQGTADLLVTAPDHGPEKKRRSWLYRFNDHRPWLLSTIVDNIGNRTELQYRSSAQAWLDEKAEQLARGQTPVSYLPFPVHTVSRVTTFNEITGVCMGRETTYLGGVWDGREREFAGFRRLIQTDTHEVARSMAAHLSPPSRTCTWFYTGVEALDAAADGAFVDMDARFPQAPPRFTQWRDDAEEALEVTGALRAWLYRAVRGQVMRIEVYGEDGHPRAGNPYRLERSRLQIRAMASADPQRPSALVTPIQHLAFSCERVPKDPVVAQTLVLAQDLYGNVLQSAAVNYPRQLSEADLVKEEGERQIYPDSLPAGLIEASCDEQQYDCWINLTRARVHNLTRGDDFVIGLADGTRRDVIKLTASDVPKDGFSVENLAVEELLVADPQRTTLVGYEKAVWRQADGTGAAKVPSRQALLAYTRTAMLDKASLDVLRPTFEQTLGNLVEQALANPNADPAVLRRVRERLPEVTAVATSYPLLMAYLQCSPHDEQALGLLRAALKTVISVDALRERLYQADAAALPEGLQAALRKQSRVADAALPAVVAWFAGQAQGSADLQHLHAAVADGLAVTGADSVFWRVVLANLATRGADLSRPVQLQAWLEDVQHLLDTRVQAESLTELLKRGGYVAMSRAEDADELAEPHDPSGAGAPSIPWAPPVEEAYCGHHGISGYRGAEHFWTPDTVQESTVIGPRQLQYTAHDIAVCRVTDAAGLTSTVEVYDWRFMQPAQIKDANDNTHTSSLDALGRVMHTRFYGTETPAGSDEAVMSGFSPEAAFTPPRTVEQAVALNESKGVPVAMAFTNVVDSWMPLALQADGRVAGTRRCGALAWQRDVQRLRRDGIEVSGDLFMAGRTPPHVIQIQPDRYDNDPEQQVRVQVSLTGGSQLLQVAILNPGGEAFVRTEEGGLAQDQDGHAVLAHAEVRWAVTGKTEFDNKGQAVRKWLPFYLDDWRWVSDDSAREGIYADTHFYDALGRECRIVRANGEDVEGEWANYEQRVQVYPWFTVSEDENDTWQEVIERARLKARSTLH